MADKKLIPRGDMKISIVHGQLSAEKKNIALEQQKTSLFVPPVKKKIKKKRYAAVDMAFSLVLVGTAVVGHWRGTWCLMDSHPTLFPAIPSFFLGGSLHWGFAILRDFQRDCILYQTPTAFNKLISFVYQRVYTYFFAAACILHWRGGWLIMDQLCEYYGSVLPTMILAGVSLAGVFVLKAVRNLIAPPFIIAIDKEDVAFTFPTRFRIDSTQKNTPVYVLDCLFSVLVVGTLVVFVWRGAWVLIDIFLFPDDEAYSAIGSLVLGYIASILAFLLQPVMRWTCERLTGVWRVLVADIYLLFSFVGTVNVWRGIWNTLNIFYLPDDPELSCWSTHIVFLLLLILLKCSNSVLVRGVYIDAEEPAGKCVVFPCYYLRLYFQRERAKKSKVQLQTLVNRRKSDMDFSKIKPLDTHLCSCHMTEAVANHIAVSVPLVHHGKEFPENHNTEA